jgi:hypothetical protein
VLTVVGIMAGRVENCEQRSVSDLAWNVWIGAQPVIVEEGEGVEVFESDMYNSDAEHGESLVFLNKSKFVMFVVDVARV